MTDSVASSNGVIANDPALADKLFKFMQFIPYTTLSMIAVLVSIGIAGSETYRTKIQSDYHSVVSFLIIHSDNVMLAIGILILLVAVTIVGYYIYKDIKKRIETKKQIQNLMIIQRNQLMRLYRSTGGDRWRDRTRWGSSESIDRWKGIHINHQTGRVNKIILPENRLIGKPS
jgi:hypothetical protein